MFELERRLTNAGHRDCRPAPARFERDMTNAVQRFLDPVQRPEEVDTLKGAVGHCDASLPAPAALLQAGAAAVHQAGASLDQD